MPSSAPSLYSLPVRPMDCFDEIAHPEPRFPKLKLASPYHQFPGTCATMQDPGSGTRTGLRLRLLLAREIFRTSNSMPFCTLSVQVAWIEVDPSSIPFSPLMHCGQGNIPFILPLPAASSSRLGLKHTADYRRLVVHAGSGPARSQRDLAFRARCQED